MDSSFLNELINSAQLSPVLIAPVALAIISAILVFVYGIRKPTEPQFKKIAASVQAGGAKKSKRKETKSSGSQSKSTTTAGTPTGSVKMTPSSQRSPTKKSPLTNESTTTGKKDTKSDTVQKRKDTGTKKSTTVTPSKKSTTTTTPKPEKIKKSTKATDLDDDGWTTVQSRTDKKKKQEDTLISQTIDSQSKKSLSGKSTKDAKQLKDQVNKSKKEASENNKKFQQKNKLVDSNEVTETIENIVNEMKKADNSSNINSPKATQTKKIANIIENVGSNDAGDEKSDDSKPVAAGVIFDEMGDAWTEAKPIKKGKKKARKE